MTTVNTLADCETLSPVEEKKSPFKVWLVTLLAGLSLAWPLLYAALAFGPKIITQSLTGDAYHYLAIARKAHIAHIYTYDGVHVTNGFHPLWQYTIRGMFALLHLESHERQAVAVMLLALASATLGIIVASAAVIRMTNHYFLGLLLVPGLYYLAIGVHVRNLWMWATLDGMESAYSVLFGGLFFFVLSFFIGAAANRVSDDRTAYAALGLVLPFLILSRLDDFFILPAFLASLLFFERSMRRRIIAGALIAGPSTIAILCYLIYNKVTVGTAMPLSGATKSGFVGFMTAYLTAAVHFPPIFELKTLLTKKPSEVPVVFSNSFRFVEMLYPFLAAAFGAAAIWKSRKRRLETAVLFAICLYIIFKTGYNFLSVHPWHQSGWYYLFITLSLSVLGIMALRKPWSNLDRAPIARNGIVTIYVLMMLFVGSQYYLSVVYEPPDPLVPVFWERRDTLQRDLSAHGVTGIINVDDGITAFLLDFPDMHGFAFATDVEAQRAYRSGRMLSLAYSRGINTIAGFGYMSTPSPPHTDAEIRQYLRSTLAWDTMKSEMDEFDFTLAYYDPALKMPFFLFKPKAG